jgi:hypothetical protein
VREVAEHDTDCELTQHRRLANALREIAASMAATSTSASVPSTKGVDVSAAAAWADSPKTNPAETAAFRSPIRGIHLTRLRTGYREAGIPSSNADYGLIRKDVA